MIKATSVASLLAIAALLAAGSPAASAAPAENEYDLDIPTGAGDGIDTQAHARPAVETGGATSETPSGAADQDTGIEATAKPDAGAVENSPSDEAKPAEFPLRGRTYALARPVEETPAAMVSEESGGGGSGWLALSGLALMAALVGGWQWRRRLSPTR